MADSPVAICNQALGWVGGDLITSLDDESKEAKLCKANYELLRDAVLEEREWTFAVERIELAKVSEDPVYGWGAMFQIPPRVIRILQISGSATGLSAITRGGTGMGQESRLEWNREGDKVMCNAGAVFARCLVQVKDTNKFSPAFSQALAARMAMDLAIPIASSRLLQKDMAQMYGEKIRLAAGTDGMQGRSQRTRSDSLTRVR